MKYIIAAPVTAALSSGLTSCKKLRRHHPELWKKLREIDERAIGQFGNSSLGRFKDNWSVEQLEQRFEAEDEVVRKEAEMSKDASEEIRDLFKGVPPKNVTIQVDDLPAKTLEQHIRDKEKTQTQTRKKKRGPTR